MAVCQSFTGFQNYLEQRKDEFYNISPCSKPPIFHVCHLPQVPHLPSTLFPPILQSTSFTLSIIYLILSSYLFFCYSRETVSFLTQKVFLFPRIFDKSAFLQSHLFIRCSTLKLSFLPCFLLQETFAHISKCHCYRPNLPKSASPTV